MGPVTAVAVVAMLIAAGASRLPLLTPGSQPTDSAFPAVSGVVPPTVGPPTVGPSTPAATGTAAIGLVGARYADGVPSLIDGEAVLRPTSVERRAPTDASTFLLGGWSFAFGRTYACPAIFGSPAPFGPRCGTPFVADTPTWADESRVRLDGWTTNLPAGPIVLRVHRHDPLAATCSTDLRGACEGMAVIEGVVWAGDEVTAAAPLSVVQTMDRLVSANTGLARGTFTAVGRLWLERQSAGPTMGPDPMASCIPPFPTLSWSVAQSGIVYVLVFPSIAAREALDQDFTASGWRGTAADGSSCFLIADSLFSHEWVAGQNVMVAVQTGVPGATAAEATRIESVRRVIGAP